MAYLFKPFGTAYWHICWTSRENGKLRWRRKTTKTADRDTAEEILKTFNDVQKRRLKRDTLTSLFKASGIDGLPEEVKLSELWDWYASHCELTGETKQQKDRANILKRFLLWMERTHPELETVQEINLRIASEYWTSLADNGAAPSTRNNNLSGLNTIWSCIQAPMELPINPWSAIKRDRHGSIPYQPFSSEEMEALRQAADRFPSTLTEPGFWPAAIEMGYYTGLRLGDIATLEHEEIKKEEDCLMLIPNKNRHWGDDRVAVHSLSLPWVLLVPEGLTGYVWPKAAAAYSSQNLSQEFTKIAIAAGIQLDREPEPGERRTKNVRLKNFHSLRHTFATDALKAGITENELRDQGNWSGTEVIHDHYNHAKLLLAKKAAMKIAKVFAKKCKNAKKE